MSVSADKLKASRITFFTACRENTGAHFLDSGCAYGRHHEREEIDDHGPEVTLDYNADTKRLWGATLSTPHYLDARFEIDRKLQSAFEKFAAKHPDLSWFEAGEAFMEARKMERAMRGNPYNGDNDLSQVFVYEVWEPQGQAVHRDSCWAHDDTVTVFYIHTGCDVRGGYGRPIFCRARGDYAIPVDVVVEYWAESGTAADGHELSNDELRGIDERWQAGYSGSPSYQLEKDLEALESVEGTVITAKLKTGETVRIHAQAPCAG